MNLWWVYVSLVFVFKTYVQFAQVELDPHSMLDSEKTSTQRVSLAFMDHVDTLCSAFSLKR